MTQITEILEEKPTVLIVSKKDHQFVSLLKHELKRYKADVFFSPTLPRDLSRFEYCFLLNEEKLPKKNLLPVQKKIAFVFINKLEQAHAAVKYYQDPSIKIVSITGDKISRDHIDRLLWFVFSQTKENLLQITAAISPSSEKLSSLSFWTAAKVRIPGRKKMLLLICVLFLLLHLAFLPPLFLSSFLFYQSADSFKQENFSKSEKFLDFGGLFFSIAKKLYLIPRSTFLFFSLTFPDFVVDSNEKSYISIQKSLKLQENAKQALKLLFLKNKTADEKALLLLRIYSIKKDITTIEENITILKQKIPSTFRALQNLKSDLARYLDLISRFKRILPYSDSLLAKNSEKTYLLLFANNMELRPGGGFIGSFGLLDVKDYSIEKIKIYDVYDADGQLIAHVEPPEAIRKYLGQPHWFLRDSAFSPDFLDNYIQAKYFLEKEMDFKNFSGSILITTSAIQNILGAFDDLYLPDFKEKINQKNFYLKTQYYSEKNFFPGSIQKKNFLGSLTQSILLDLENASSLKLARELKKSLDDKQIVVYFDDPQLQKVTDSFYWSGRTIDPSCANEVENCIVDYILPVDANLGLNKANFFVTRSLGLKISFDSEGRINNTFTIQLNNDSSDVFPGGTYRNYFQFLLPRTANIKNISKDGVLLEDFTEEADRYKKIGILLEIKPKTIIELKITYNLEENLKKGKNIYQLIAQKQIGASNSDFALELNLPKNLHLLNQNFPALVKDNRIVYNTTLSTDKIFIIELIKE